MISGLCHYFGIADPTWARIAAVILIPLTSGSIILLYLLMLIVVPKAYTSAEKLQMKGEPINISTIQKEIKDSMTVVATTTLTVAARCSVCTGLSLDRPIRAATLKFAYEVS